MSQPIKKIKVGSIDVSMWENENNGKKFYSFTIQKSYKDKEEKWHQTQSYNLTDLRDIKDAIEYLRLQGIKKRNDDTKLADTKYEDVGPKNEDIPF